MALYRLSLGHLPYALTNNGIAPTDSDARPAHAESISDLVFG